MTARVEAPRTMWLRLWELMHGPVTVSTPEDHARADAQIASLEAALRVRDVVEADLPIDPERHDDRA